MCRSIKTLFNFAPPATEQEIRAASLQFVRKLSGFTNPSKANRAAFDRAVDEVAASARVLIDALITTAEPRAPRRRGRAGARENGSPIQRRELTAQGHAPTTRCGLYDLSQGGAEPPKCSALNAPDTREGCEVGERVMCVVPPNTETGNK